MDAVSLKNHVLPDDIAAGVSDLMHYANLSGGLREYGADSIGEAVQIICDGNQNILYSASLKIGQNRHPERLSAVL